jgi:hypothetical protein
MMRSAIEAEGLVKVFGQVRALDSIDLVAREATVFGLLGPTAPARPLRSGCARPCFVRTRGALLSAATTSYGTRRRSAASSA